MEAIIVTARRREEALQKAPVSVVALSAKDLEARSVTNLRTLQNFVPNLTFAPSQNVGEASGNAFIRGIGQEDFAASAEPGVGFYVDGIYFARTTGTMMNLLDVRRIEVLRGPQGTLFGKNTIGGAINIVSAMPGPKLENRFGLIAGSFSRGEVNATTNVPLSDQLFVRLSLSGVRRGGYFRRLDPPASIAAIEVATGEPINLRREGSERSLGGRAQLRWLVERSVTADFSIDASRRRGTQGAIHIDAIDPRYGILPQLNLLIAQGKLPGPPITAALLPRNLFQSHAGGPNDLVQDLWGGSVTISKRLGRAELKLIASRRGQRSDIGTDTDGLYFSITDQRIGLRQSQASGELQLIGTGGRLAYTAGLFAFEERIRLLPATTLLSAILYTCGCFYPPGTIPRTTSDKRRLTSDSIAAYAQASYELADRLSVTLGGRMSRDKKSIEAMAYQLDANLDPTDALIATAHNKGKWSAFTYHAGLEFQATRDLMAYVSVAKGFKSGGFNARTSLNLPNLGYAAFRPETAVTFEGGVRSEWLRRRLRVNATVFQTAYDDLQMRVQSFSGGLLTTLIQSAGHARVRGAEIEITAKPTARMEIGAAYGHIDAHYLDIGEVQGLTLDSRFQRTPSHSLSVSAGYAVPIHAGTLRLHGDYSFRSREQFQLAAAPNDQRAYGLLGAKMNFETLDGLWTFAISGTNLANVRYRTAGRGTQIHQTGIIFSSVGAPRQASVEILRRF